MAGDESARAESARVGADARTRWVVLGLLCLGSLMIVLDSTVVSVALPSISEDLGFSDSSLAWVVNAYLLTYGGFLLLSGRTGDILGARGVLLFGIALFTLASLACGLSSTPGMLVVSRAVQGVGGATVEAVGLALIMRMFTEPGDRAKAIAVFSAVAAGGGTIGVLVGGILTDLVGWHWIFLINVPVGAVVLVVLARLLPASERAADGPVDVAGALTVTTALIVATYAIVDGNDAGWGSLQTIGLLAVAVALFAAFVVIELRARIPLVPLNIFRVAGFAAGGVIVMFFGVGRVASYVPAALYLQFVLGYDPLQVGLAYVPWTVIWGVAALGLSGRMAQRFGFQWSTVVGLTLFAIGLLLFIRLPVDADFVRDVLPGMLLQGLGAGIAYTPITLGAMHNVRHDQAGLGTGIFTTMYMLSAALGLAAITAIADFRTEHLQQAGESELAALSGGYHAAFGAAALVLAVGVVVALVGFRRAGRAEAGAPEVDRRLEA